MMDPIDQLGQLINQPDSWNFTGAKRFYAGIDLGTYKTIAIIIDETGTPRAASMRRTEVARSGLIVDYVGALNTTRDLMEEMRKWSQHYTRAAFIDTGLGDSAPYERMARDKADKEGWIFERLQGNNRLLAALVNGSWAEADFLVVPPGHTIRQDFRDERLVKAVKNEP